MSAMENEWINNNSKHVHNRIYEYLHRDIDGYIMWNWIVDIDPCYCDVPSKAFLDVRRRLARHSPFRCWLNWSIVVYLWFQQSPWTFLWLEWWSQLTRFDSSVSDTLKPPALRVSPTLFLPGAPASHFSWKNVINLHHLHISHGFSMTKSLVV